MSVTGPSAGVAAAFAVNGSTSSPSPLLRSSAATPIPAADALGPGSAARPPEFTERHRLLAALQERAAATAAAAAAVTPRPNNGCAANGVCAALADEHSSILRCLDLLQESGDEMVNLALPPPKTPEETKIVKKRQRKKMKRNHGDSSMQLTIINDKYPNPRRRRTSKTPPNSAQLSKQRIQNLSQRELSTSHENMKQRTIKYNTRKKLATDQKQSISGIKSQKPLADKRKKILRTASSKKLKTVGNLSKNTPRTQSSTMIAIPDDKKQVKHRRWKYGKVYKRSSRESLELALVPLDRTYETMHLRADGDGPKRIAKKTRRFAKKHTLAVPTTNVHRKPEGRKVPNTPRKGIIKRQPAKDKSKGSVTLNRKGECPLKLTVSNLPEIDTSKLLNTTEVFGLDGRSTRPIEVTPILSSINISTKTNLPCFGAPLGNLSMESVESQQSVTPETTETCLRSILRDSNKKLVSIGSKTVRFFEDTLPVKKGKKRKLKGFAKKSVSTERKNVRPNPNGTPRVTSREGGFSRTVTPEKNVDTGRKKRGKSTVKEKKVPVRPLEDFHSDNELLEDKREDSVVEVTPLKQKKLYEQVQATERKAGFPRSRSEETLDRSSINDLPSNSPSTTTNTTANSLQRNTAKDSNLQLEGRKSLRKLLSIDDSHVPNSLILRCQRNSLKDMTNRYSHMLADIHKTKDQASPVEKTSRSSMKSHYSIFEDLLQKKPPAIPIKKRSTDMTKHLNTANRNPGPKPAIFSLGTNNNPKKRVEDDKVTFLRNPNRKSLSQTSLKNSTRMINSDHILIPRHSRTGMSRHSLEIPLTASNQKMNLRYLGTRRDLAANLPRSVSTSQTTTRCKLAPKDAKSLFESDKRNFLPQEDKKSVCYHNWRKRTRADDVRYHSCLVNNGEISRLPPSPTSLYAERPIRKKSSCTHRIKVADSLSSYDTIKSRDEINFSENPISDGDSIASRRVHGENCPFVHLAQIGNSPSLIRSKSPKYSINKSGWKNNPAKYIFEVVSGDPSENTSNTSKSNKNYNRSSKNKIHECQRIKSREWKTWVSETEDEGSRTINNSERSDSTGRRSRCKLVKNKQQKWCGSKTAFLKNIPWSRPTRIERKQSPNTERYKRSLQDTRSWSGHRIFSSRSKPMDSRIYDGHSSQARLKALRADDSFTTTNSCSFTSVRKSNQPSRNRMEEKRYAPSFRGSSSTNNTSRRGNRRKLECFDLNRL